MAAAVPADLQAVREYHHLLCSPQQQPVCFLRDLGAGSSWQLATQEAESSENAGFSQEIKSRAHNSATDGRAESSGLRAGIASSSTTRACCTAQTGLLLLTTRSHLWHRYRY